LALFASAFNAAELLGLLFAERVGTEAWGATVAVLVAVVVGATFGDAV
jgi:hypothetical protein